MNTLYRFFSSDDVLLYVGRTINPRTRLRTHARSKDWYEDAVRIEMERFPDIESLALAEIEAIKKERPVHNLQHNSRRKKPTSAWGNAPDAERIVERAISAGLTELDETCEYPEAGSEHNCIECIRATYAYLDEWRDYWSGDHTAIAELGRIERRYRNGGTGEDAYCDANDFALFRRVKFAELSKVAPLPGYAEITEAGTVFIECGFCKGVHEFHAPAGAALDAFQSPCDTPGRLTPIFDPTDALDLFYQWEVLA